MNFLQRLTIRVRLLLLAGVPVIGALVLAAVIALDARQRAAAAAALGSVEDLATLSAQMSATTVALQNERAWAARDEGRRHEEGYEAPPVAPHQFATTDEQRRRLEQLLAGRNLSKLPPRLIRELETARMAMDSLPAFREKLRDGSAPIDDLLTHYGSIVAALVNATEALSQLTDDGEVIRSSSALVAISEVAERVSIEHAILANVSERKQFAPGLFKMLVTVGTEQAIYEASFRANAPEDLVRLWDKEEQTTDAVEARRLRDGSVATTDDVIDLDPNRWYDSQQTRIRALNGIVDVAAHSLSGAATRKVRATRASIRLGIGLSLIVVVVSAFLAVVIRNGITRSVDELATAAARIKATKDFSIRANKVSNDELGMFTDIFNEMLRGVQSRDLLLLSHRNNLEELVWARTEQVAQRNQSMRFVLDNVEQGLAMIRLDGTFHLERSAKFDALLGIPEEATKFAQLIDPEGGPIAETLQLGWETACEGMIPVDIALDQLPKQVFRDGRHLTLDFRPVVRDDIFEGALLVVTDVTNEIEARLEHERQSEYVAIFERVVQDREGFFTFSEETGALVDQLASGQHDVPSVMKIVHTIKGNAGQWGVSSVASIAHDLESEVADVGGTPSDELVGALIDAWKDVIGRLSSLVGAGADDRIELARSEVDELLADVRDHVDHDMLAERVERFYCEPATIRFHRLENDIERLAHRLEKPKPEVLIEADGVRLPARRFGSFWTAMVHVVRNMMDHGIETPETRLGRGKPEAGRIVLRAVETRDRIRIECEDDGGGIDWNAVAEKARSCGLPYATKHDLEAALFAAGVTTARQVSDISGRGVGLAAVLERCHALGGEVDVLTTEGRGTRFVFSFPRRLAFPTSGTHLSTGPASDPVLQVSPAALCV